jgi:hypothetical protein
LRLNCGDLRAEGCTRRGLADGNMLGLLTDQQAQAVGADLERGGQSVDAGADDDDVKRPFGVRHWQPSASLQATGKNRMNSVPVARHCSEDWWIVDERHSRPLRASSRSVVARRQAGLLHCGAVQHICQRDLVLSRAPCWNITAACRPPVGLNGLQEGETMAEVTPGTHTALGVLLRGQPARRPIQPRPVARCRGTGAAGNADHRARPDGHSHLQWRRGGVGRPATRYGFQGRHQQGRRAADRHA